MPRGHHQESLACTLQRNGDHPGVSLQQFAETLTQHLRLHDVIHVCRPVGDEAAVQCFRARHRLHALSFIYLPREVGVRNEERPRIQAVVWSDEPDRTGVQFQRRRNRPHQVLHQHLGVERRADRITDREEYVLRVPLFAPRPHIHELGLGLVQRTVGMCDQRLRIGSVVRVHRDAVGSRHTQVLVGGCRSDRGLFDRLRDRSRHVMRPGTVRIGQQHGEFVAAVPRDDPAATHLVVNSPPDRCDKRIAGLVSEAVVHRLEVIQVQHDDSELRLLVGSLAQLKPQRLAQVAVVVQTGEFVALRQFLQRRHVTLLLVLALSSSEARRDEGSAQQDRRKQHVTDGFQRVTGQWLDQRPADDEYQRRPNPGRSEPVSCGGIQPRRFIAPGAPRIMWKGRCQRQSSIRPKDGMEVSSDSLPN